MDGGFECWVITLQNKVISKTNYLLVRMIMTIKKHREIWAVEVGT